MDENSAGGLKPPIVVSVIRSYWHNLRQSIEGFVIWSCHHTYTLLPFSISNCSHVSAHNPSHLLPLRVTMSNDNSNNKKLRIENLLKEDPKNETTPCT
jgi:hypothetical protein